MHLVMQRLGKENLLEEIITVRGGELANSSLLCMFFVHHGLIKPALDLFFSVTCSTVRYFPVKCRRGSTLFIRHTLYSMVNLLIYFTFQRPTTIPSNLKCTLLMFNSATLHLQLGQV